MNPAHAEYLCLHAAQDMIRDFHDRFRAYTQETPALPPAEVLALRVRLIQEEAHEVEVAARDRDFVGWANELADLVYVTIGAACASGIDLGPILAAIHRANMAKGEPVVRMRADGKVLKPDGWKPADIAALLKAQGWAP